MFTNGTSSSKKIVKRDERGRFEPRGKRETEFALKDIVVSLTGVKESLDMLSLAVKASGALCHGSAFSRFEVPNSSQNNWGDLVFDF